MKAQLFVQLMSGKISNLHRQLLGVVATTNARWSLERPSAWSNSEPVAAAGTSSSSVADRTGGSGPSAAGQGRELQAGP